MHFSDLTPLVQETVQSFCEKYIQSQNTLIILVVGSYAIGKQKMNSDVDIYIIQERNNKRKRGNTWIGDLEVEYFVNPISQVYNYLVNEVRIRPVTATMINHGIIYYQREDEIAAQAIDKLMQSCADIVTADLPVLTEVDIELLKYNMDDLEKDLLDLFHDKSWINYQLITNQLITQSIEVLFRINRKSMPKFKRIDKYLMKLDMVLFGLISKLIEEPREISNVRNLVSHVEKLLGGKRKREWLLESDLTSYPQLI